MRGKKFKDEDECCICGVKQKDLKRGRVGSYEGKIYCPRHLTQMRRYGKIKHIEYKINIGQKCCICGDEKRIIKFKNDGKYYCKKHYLHMYRHGKVLEHTIFDKNDYVDNIEEGYTECILRDKNFNEVARTKIDLDKKEELKKYKVYMRVGSNGKKYAIVSLKNGEKMFLQRLLLGLFDKNYTLDKCVDHINGDSLDNRLCNLRICHHKDNMKNIRKGKKHICGISWLRWNQKWTARIMYEYKSVHIGNFDTFEEAVLARLSEERKLFGEYGSSVDYYYVLNAENPIEEIKKIGFEKPEQLPPPYDVKRNTFTDVK